MSVLSYRESDMQSSSILSQNLKVLYEDTQVIAVVKPHGVLSQGDSTGDPSLFDAVKMWLKVKYDKPGNVYLGLVHRLDRPTAGIMVFAKTSKAASRLSEQMRNHGLKKRYRAWISNPLKPEKGTLIHYLDFNEIEKKSKAYEKPKDGSQKAVLNYSTQKIEKKSILVGLELITGRKHQIRAQLSAVGSPILGDKKYGSSEVFKKGAIALESCFISFIHPTNKTLIELTISEEESAIIGGFT